MRKKQTNKNSGFTVIEVLIVLAVIGMIMLIVFLAVPALQRNARNNSRKKDIGRVGGAVTEFLSNNNGTVPVAANLPSIQASAGPLSQYVDTDGAIASGAQAVLASIASYRIVTVGKCGASGATVAGSSRQIAIQYMVETSGGSTALCQDV
jgi:prepilin-type N-terminal cleavage/methylation domain-containing protein